MKDTNKLLRRLSKLQTPMSPETMELKDDGLHIDGRKATIDEILKLFPPDKKR